MVLGALLGETSADTVRGLVLIAVLVPCAVIDARRRIIPNKITGPAALAGVVLVAVLAPSALAEHVLAGVAACAFLFVAAWVQPGGMGMGDVKLAGVLGIFLGRDVGVALLVALAAGTLAGVALVARRGVRDGRKTTIAFGPFLALGGLVAVVWGPAITAAYLRAFG